ncbi:MAG TPA: hypothetical protein VF785_01305 [Gemmatimonadaceae bacterium]
MSVFLRRVLIIGVIAVVAVPGSALAQMRVSVGAGAGIAGSTDASLSEGRTAPVVMGQVTAMAAVVGIGAEVDGWRNGTSSVLIASGDLQFRVPSTPLFVKLGAGAGRGDPDGKGTITGTAGHVGAAYDIGLSATRAVTVFGNAFLVYAPARSFQMVDGGLAITWR